MIKLSKVQKEIESLSEKVPQITQAQMEWAEKTFCYGKWVKSTAKEMACPSCKESISLENKKKGSKYHKVDCKITCPHCGAQIQILSYDDYHNGKKRSSQLQEGFFEVLNVVGDWQVTRLIYMRRYCYVRRNNTEWEYHEVCQAWNNPKNENTYFRSLPKKFMPTWKFNPYSISSWGLEVNAEDGTSHIYKNYYNELEARRPNGANYFETDSIAPRPQILSQYMRMGINADFLRKKTGYSAIGWFQKMGGKNYKPMFETLIKAKEYELIKAIGGRSWRKSNEMYFDAWKITRRHHYKIKNVDEWLDMISLLKDLKMDFHNPIYVCPKDEHAAHQKLVDTQNANLKKKREKELLEKAMKQNAEYVKRIAKYLDMDIHNDTLHIVVLPNIKAFKEEGDRLGHCVFSCRYYLHTDSIILSARDMKGKRWETIEVSLRDFTIIQAYGYGDKHTERHKEIVSLVESNMWQIKKRYKMAS